MQTFIKKLSNIILFFFIWIILGFSLGFAVVVLPFQYLSQTIQTYHLSQDTENQIARVLIALFAIGSAFISAWLVSLINRATWYMKGALLLFVILSGASGYWLLLNPERLSLFENDILVYNAKFAFGSYPSQKLLRDLKSRGYTAVISLLDPQYLPFEATLLEKEKMMVKQAGLELIHVPMRPWIDDKNNQEAIQKLENIITYGEGRYYIHCNLGRDRNGLVRRALEKLTPHSEVVSLTRSGDLSSIRYLLNGPIIRLDDQLYIAPKLTRDELTRLVSTNIKEFVIINLNETDNWARKEVIELKNLSIPFRKLVLSTYPYDPQEILEVAQLIKHLPRPLLIYVPAIDSYYVQALVEAYQSNVPSLPYILFKTPLKRGKVSLAKTNIAFGPRPETEEFKFYLKPRGIRQILYLGNNDSPEALADKQAAEANQMEWHTSLDPLNHVLANLEDGPWYLYGPNVDPHILALTDKLTNGPVERLNIQVYLTPHPTKEELSTTFLNSNIQTVIAVTSKGEKTENLEVEKQFLKKHGIRFEQVELSDSYSPQDILNLAEKIWNRPKAVVVQMKDTQSYIAEAIRQAYFTHLPPIPPAILNQTVARDLHLELAAPNVAVGWYPTADEISKLSSQMGIKEIVGIDSSSLAERKDNELYLLSGNLDCKKNIPASECIYSNISSGGPWYIYSKEPQHLQEILISRLGPPVPHVVLHYPTKIQSSTALTSFQIENAEEEVYFSRYNSNFFPNLSLTILITPPLILFTMLSASFVGWLRSVKKMHYSSTRKIFHLLIFTMAAFLQVTMHFPAVLVFSVIVVISLSYAIIQNRGLHFYDAIARPFSEEADRNFSIIVPTLMTGLSALLGFIFFGNFFIVGLLICGWGDAAAELVGIRGHYEYHIPSLIGKSTVKTWEGSAAMLIIGTTVAWIALIILGLDGMSALRIGLAAAAVGTVAEALSNAYIDNFTVQLFSTATAYFLSQ